MAVIEDDLRYDEQHEPRSEPDPRRWKALAVLALVQFMIVIDITVVNVALPSIQRALHFSGSGLAWIVDGYALMAGGLLLLGGRAGDLLGRRRLFLIGSALFAVASFTSGAAQNQTMLIMSRFAQGAGEALASPAALALVVLLFTDTKERTRALGIWGGLAGLGATVGVVLSGLIINFVSWRWIFFINVPIAVTAIALVPRLVSESKAEGASRRFDIPGAVLVTGGVLALVDGFLAASRHPWGSPAVLWPLIVGVAALAALIIVERRNADPLIPLSFFSNRTRVSANVATAVMASGLFGMFFLLTLYLQQVLHYSPLKTGLAYVPFGVGLIAGIAVSTKILERVGARTVITAAYGLAGFGLLLLGGVHVHGSYAGDLLPTILMLSFGMGAGFPAIQIAALHEVSEQDAGLGSGLQATVMQVGGSLGLAVLVTVALRRAGSAVASGTSAAVAATQGYALAFRIAALALFAAAVVAFALVPKRPEQAAPDALQVMDLEAAFEETV
ncbi:MAG: DHA2 family efflux MFS transporter permease subunit [Actinobacteria bacterium]|nr:MAG: DHA2 family efflux MFS transporter permease subunit [Actinomycetota bacterium]